MKCPNCNSEWNASPQMGVSLQSCPFCGKPLASATTQKENTLESVLCQIASYYGMEALCNGHQMIGYFTDLAPDLKRESRMLKYFVDAGGHTALFNVRNAGTADQKLGMERAVRKMVDEYLVAEDAARTVCGAYWVAVGGKHTQSKQEISNTISPRIELRKTANQPSEQKPILESVSQVTAVSHTAKQKSLFQIIQQKDYGILHFPDGSIKAFTAADSIVLEARFWKNINAYSGGDAFLVGLGNDGTVRIAGVLLGHKEVQKWSNISALAAGSSHIVGLCSDGTVKAGGSNLYSQCHTQNWTGITAIAAGANHSVGLRADGTVYASGDNKYGQCNTREWVDIISITAGEQFTAGLRRDGTVVVAGLASIVKETSGWKNVIEIASGKSHIVGLCNDGTVKAISSTNDLFNNRCNVKKWTDVTAVAADNTITVGMRPDGTILSTNPGFLRRFP